MIRTRRTIAAATATLALLAGVACSSPSDDEKASSSTTGGDVTSVPGLPDAALEVMGQPMYANASWGISVVDLDTGEVLVDLADDEMLEPGSVIKNYSMGAAWLLWGPDHTVVTPVKRTGEVVEGTVQGDLVLVGKGDLTMGGRTKPDGTVDFANLDHNDANPLPGATLTPEDPLAGLDDLAAQVKASGINSVSGQVVVDDRLFQDELDGLPVTPIIINQNLIDFTVTPGAVGAIAPAEMSPKVSPWSVVSEVETVAAGGETAIDIDSPQDGTVVLSGTVAADSDPVLKVWEFEDPATYARTAFIEALERAGVVVGGDPIVANSTAGLGDAAAVDALPSVAELESLSLEEEATYVLKVSYNRGAQTMICRIAIEAGSKKCSAGLTKAGQLWSEAGLEITSASIVDGSGLTGNFATPANQTQLQTIMAKRSDAARWQATLPILGVDGSLATVEADSPATGKVFAKTGTLVDTDSFNGRARLEAKALGGTIDAESGRRLAFAIFVNNGFVDGILGVFDANDHLGEIAALIQQDH